MPDPFRRLYTGRAAAARALARHRTDAGAVGPTRTPTVRDVLAVVA